MNAFSAIAIQLQEDAWWVLSTPECDKDLAPENASYREVRPGLKGHEATGPKLPPILLMEAPDGSMTIRLLETQRYEWGVIGATDIEVSSSLETLPGRQWSVRKLGMLGGSFSVVNHLGIADFTIQLGHSRFPFQLEIISAKLDYDTEYRQITEDIAAFCQQVLLNWDAPTSLGFAVDPEHASRLMLEQFLFLRSHLHPERLGELLESIQRRPNSRLMSHPNWTPSSKAGSTDWLKDPAGMSRDWRVGAAGTHPRPGLILDLRKDDTVDTAANRFVKFALSQFRDLCQEVQDKHSNALSLAREAEELGHALDAALSRPFFRGLGRLSRLPLDNPTLQKRDGYREILHAWLLTQSASALNWDRTEESYHGPTRNVATLYEYWIFLQLHQILDEMQGVSRDEGNPKPVVDAEPFLQIRHGEVMIHLKRGKKTCAPFTVKLATGMVLKLHLYYERTFQLQHEATSPASYSRQFKPDYTLAIFPDRFPNEQDAAAEGKISYLHFDAKYRAENLKMIFGDLQEDDEELNDEKQAGKATSTYKRGDLLKMHTYNDAVRQTAGSYVLYPGSETAAKMCKFHEILPGVGAFVLKPGNEASREALKNFLSDVFQHQADQFTQFRHFSDVQHATVREEPKAYGAGNTHRPNATCILVFVKEAIRDLSREKRLVYCRALKEDGSPVPIKLGNMAGAVLCPYSGSHAGERHTIGWQAAIESCEMMSLSALKAALKTSGWPEGMMPKTASAYLLFRLDAPAGKNKRTIQGLVPRATYEAVSCSLNDMERCLDV